MHSEIECKFKTGQKVWFWHKEGFAKISGIIEDIVTVHINGKITVMYELDSSIWRKREDELFTSLEELEENIG